MTTDLARPQSGGRELAQSAPIDNFKLLDRHSETGFAEEQTRLPWLATISAGRLVAGPNNTVIPRASRKADEHWIHMTPEDAERAPGLYEALEANGFRWFDAAVPFDDPNLFLQQHFEKRSATRLEAYGDARELTEIELIEIGKRDNKPVYRSEHVVHPRGSDGYARLIPQCKESTSFFFALARWDGSQPRLYFPDGLGVYRLRFTSRHSAREILATLRQLSALTGGKLAGLPLRFTLDFREVADPLGMRREIPVWKPRFMPPQQMELTPALWQDLKSKALAEGALLRANALPAPPMESIDTASEEFELADEPSSAPAIAALQDGPPCDARYYQQAFFARIKDTSLDNDEARAGFVEGVSGGRTTSLTEFLATATEAQAAAMIAAAGQIVGSENVAAKAKRYDEIFGTDDDQVAPPAAPGASMAADRQTLWAENRRLSAQAQKLGLSGVPVLINTSANDVLAEANRVLEERITNLQLDQKLAAEQARFDVPEKGPTHGRR